MRLPLKVSPHTVAVQLPTTDCRLLTGKGNLVNWLGPTLPLTIFTILFSIVVVNVAAVARKDRELPWPLTFDRVEQFYLAIVIFSGIRSIRSSGQKIGPGGGNAIIRDASRVISPIKGCTNSAAVNASRVPDKSISGGNYGGICQLLRDPLTMVR